MKFTKMQGCGNDYVYINGFEEHILQEKKPEIVRKISDRHFGIGSDGAIFINPSTEADFEMEMYNADGSRSEMCGNGIRCVGKYVYDHGMTDRTELTVISAGKVKYLSLTIKDGKVSLVRVNMGSPILVPEEIPVDITKACHAMQPDMEDKLTHMQSNTEKKLTDMQSKTEKKLTDMQSNTEKKLTDMQSNTEKKLTDMQPNMEDKSIDIQLSMEDKLEEQPKDRIVNEPIIVKGCEYHMTCVSMGNPHAVVFMEGVDQLDIDLVGPYFENHTAFPKRTNTEFVEVIDRTHIRMRVYERGTGETLACGTGCCASVVACILNGKTKEDVSVSVLGGIIRVKWDRDTNQIYMTGPAETVFEGEINV